VVQQGELRVAVEGVEDHGWEAGEEGRRLRVTAGHEDEDEWIGEQAAADEGRTSNDGWSIQ
jgi:hypothetical protein